MIKVINTKNEKRVKLYILPLLSGVIYGLAWNIDFLSILELVSIVPFFISIDFIRSLEVSNKKKIKQLLIAVFLFRTPIILIILCWMFSISIVALALLVATEFILFSLSMLILIYKRMPFIAIVFVLSLYELIMQNVVMLVPFYQMGYAWGDHISFIQYYSLIGIEGASLLIYLVNFAFFKWMNTKKLTTFSKIVFILFAGLTIYSLTTYYWPPTTKKSKDLKVSIIHCHIQSKDSIYRAKPMKLIDSVARIAQPNSLVILPEVFFNDFGWARNLTKNNLLKHIDSIENVNHQIYLVGAYLVGQTNHPTPQSRYSEIYKIYFDAYNVSMLIDNVVKIRSKRKFIPFFEYIPNNAVAQWVNKYITNIGDDRKVTILDRKDRFTYKGIHFNSLLCYESLYPLIVAKHAVGNQFIVVQANENWNKSELMSRQYFKVNKANTIQVGIPTYRSSNDGYSAIISTKGKAIFKYKTGKSFSSLNGYLSQDTQPSIYCSIIGWSYWVSGIGLIALLLIGSNRLYKN